jgi:SAM-dependent methyltransferase
VRRNAEAQRRRERFWKNLCVSASLRFAGALCLVAVAGAQAPSKSSSADRQLYPPENLGLLEAPDRHIWQKPDQIMDALGIADGSVVADIGAGSGWFTIHLARRVGPRGVVYAQDVQRQMLEAIRRRVTREGLRNVQTRLGSGGRTGLPAGALDAVLVVDVYPEVDDPVALLKSLAVALKPTGRIGIVNYKPGASGPGPPPGERVEQNAVEADVRAAGLRVVSQGAFLPFQYLLVVSR